MNEIPKRKKLALSKQTLRRLSAEELSVAHGQGTIGHSGCGCKTTWNTGPVEIEPL